MAIFLFLLGTIIGSFLNVCIYRIPKKESIVFPGSYCPNCSTPLKWYDLVPVLSFLFLKGKCRCCGERISPRYPTVE
ncbi:prepilin peptidase, partial [Schnuerera sp.]|uniref:prepilin peptidase n=1 Tax=Schnuerera sp. TaxID=2794844 RepID=UPI002C83C6A5